MDLSDFEISVDALDAGAYAVRVRSPAGESRSTTRLPLEGAALAERFAAVRAAVLRSGASETGRDLVAVDASGAELPGGAALSADAGAQLARETGAALFETLLPNEVRDAYRVALSRARERGQGVRVRLRIEPPELTALPWEFLYDAREGEYLSLSSETPVVRYLEVDRPPAPLGVALPIRVLGMIASPGDLPPLAVDIERARVEQAIGDLQKRGLIELTWVERGSFAALQSALRRGPWHIFHFVGHGGFDESSGEGLIALEREPDGVSTKRPPAHRLPASIVGQLLLSEPALRLALLNSCEGARGDDKQRFSSTAATLVRRGIPAVVAMQYEISDRAAIEFAQAFYAGIADAAPVDAAMAQARLAIRGQLDGSLEWGTPVLFMRAPDGVLFRIGDEKATTAPVAAPTAAPAPSSGGINITIGGDASGQLVVGNQNNVVATRAAAAAPVNRDELLARVRRDVLAPLEKRVEGDSPPAVRDKALERLSELDAAITGAAPDVTTIAYVYSWFGRAAPGLAPAVLALIHDDSVLQLVDAADPAAAAALRRL